MTTKTDKPKLIIPAEAEGGLSAGSNEAEAEAPTTATATAIKHPRGHLHDGYLAPDLGGVKKISCDKCICSYFPVADLNNGSCRGQPPKLQILFLAPKPPAVAGAPPGPPIGHVDAAWAPIFRDQWCVRGFLPKPGLSQ